MRYHLAFHFRFEAGPELFLARLSRVLCFPTKHHLERGHLVGIGKSTFAIVFAQISILFFPSFNRRRDFAFLSVLGDHGPDISRRLDLRPPHAAALICVPGKPQMNVEVCPDSFALVVALELFLCLSFSLGAEECPHNHIEGSEHV